MERKVLRTGLCVQLPLTELITFPGITLCFLLFLCLLFLPVRSCQVIRLPQHHKLACDSLHPQVFIIRPGKTVTALFSDHFKASFDLFGTLIN